MPMRQISVVIKEDFEGITSIHVAVEVTLEAAEEGNSQISSGTLVEVADNTLVLAMSHLSTLLLSNKFLNNKLLRRQDLKRALRNTKRWPRMM